MRMLDDEEPTLEQALAHADRGSGSKIEKRLAQSLRDAIDEIQVLNRTLQDYTEKI